MDYSPIQIEKKARDKDKANRELIKNLNKKYSRDLDELFQNAHYRAFMKIDCLNCAICCKSLGPRLNNQDIERLAKFLKMKSSVFIESCLHIDEDNDYVFKRMPCIFLDNDNKCRVYEQRPKACREYPHTDRKKIHQILTLTLKNSYVCPAVNEIFDEIRNRKEKR